MTLHACRFAAPETRPLTLGLLTPHNVYDPRAFSGTVYHAAKALARTDGIDLRPLGSHHRPPGLGDRLTQRLRRTGCAPRASLTDALSGLDAVVGLVATDLLDRLPPDIPYIHATDATPGFLRERYGLDIDTTTCTRETRVAQAATACLYSSREMARRARGELGLSRVDAVPFGVNLDPNLIQRAEKPPLRPLELLYVGANWDRKGGEIALAALAHLRDLGVPARLRLVGRIPNHARHTPGVTVAGFLDKRRPRDARHLSDLYARAHLLVLPTRGDCTPMVIAEAMAHGTPVLATATGGIPEMIGRGAGHTLPMSARAEDWAGTIADMTRDRDAYALLSDAAHDRGVTRFSWDAWAREVAKIAGEVSIASARAT